MLSDVHEYGNNAEREAARCADRMLGGGDREELLNWFRIGRTIAVMRQAPTGATAMMDSQGRGPVDIEVKFVIWSSSCGKVPM